MNIQMETTELYFLVIPLKRGKWKFCGCFQGEAGEGTKRIPKAATEQTWNENQAASAIHQRRYDLLQSGTEIELSNMLKKRRTVLYMNAGLNLT